MGLAERDSKKRAAKGVELGRRNDEDVVLNVF